MNVQARQPTATEILQRAGQEGAWRVPVELVLACPSSSIVKGLTATRMARGDNPRPEALVFARGDRLFGVIDFFGAGRPGLLLPLDVWRRP